MTKFKIEHIIVRADYGLIMLKYLSGERDFRITGNSRLEAVLLEEYLEMPREVDRSGKIKLNTFIVKPNLKSDLDKFVIGQIVSLE